MGELGLRRQKIEADRALREFYRSKFNNYISGASAGRYPLKQIETKYGMIKMYPDMGPEVKKNLESIFNQILEEPDFSTAHTVYQAL